MPTPQEIAAELDLVLPDYPGVPRDVVERMIGVESGGRADAVSPKGAKGIMQLMPGTARDMGVQDPLDWRQNLRGGVKYLAQNLDRFGGDVLKAIGAYHSGPGAVEKAGGIPDTHDGIMSTREYVARIAGDRGDSAVAPTARSQNGRMTKPRKVLPGWEDSELLSPLTTIAPPPAKPSSIWRDMAGVLWKGVHNVAEDFKEGVRLGLGSDVVDAIESLGEKLSTPSLDDVQAKTDAALSPEMREALGKQWVTEDEEGNLRPGPALTDWRSLAGGLMQSIPGTVVTMVPAFRVGRLAEKIVAGRAAAAGLSGEAAKEAGARALATFGAAAGAVFEGAQGGVQGSREVRETIEKMPERTLLNSQVYRGLLAQNGGDVDAARAQLADDQATQAFLLAGVGTGIFGGAGDKVLFKLMRGRIAGGLPRRAGVGAAAEGFEEAGQGAASQVGQNIALQEADPSLPTTQGVANQVVGGAVIGAAMGGGMGAAFGRRASEAPAEAAPAVPAQPVEEAPESTPSAPAAAGEASVPPTAPSAPQEPVAAVQTEPTPPASDAPPSPADEPTGDIGRRSDGAPFASRHAAAVAAKEMGLKGPHAIVRVGPEGFVLRPVSQTTNPAAVPVPAPMQADAPGEQQAMADWARDVAAREDAAVAAQRAAPRTPGMLDGDVGRASDGTPFLNRDAAKKAAARLGLGDTHDIVKLGKDAFIVRPKPVESEAPVAPATPQAEGLVREPPQPGIPVATAEPEEAPPPAELDQPAPAADETPVTVPAQQGGQSDTARGLNGIAEPRAVTLDVKGKPIEMRRLGVGSYELLDGEERVGRVNYTRLPSGEWKVTGIEVKPERQRQGIATAVYDHLEKHVIGGRFADTGSFTPDGRAFRDARDGKRISAKWASQREAERTLREKLMGMTYPELDAAAIAAHEQNDRAEVEIVREVLGEEAAKEFQSKSASGRRKWAEAHWTTRMDDLADERLQDADTISAYRDAAQDFDTESPELLGRSILQAMKKADAPDFATSPAALTMRNAIAYAQEQGWDLDKVTAGARKRAREVYGDDAPELVERLFRPSKKAAAPAPAAPALEDKGVDAGAHEAAISPQNELPEPSKEQILAGNAKLGHVKVGGLDISIENPAGSIRKDLKNDPPKWSNEMKSHYGYVKRTEGADGDHIDVFVKPGTPEDYSGPVFVVNQVNASGKFDEVKAMIGFPDEKSARAGYLENYSKGWKGGRSVRATTMAGFKEWLATGDTTKAFPAEAIAAARAPKATGRGTPRELDASQRAKVEAMRDHVGWAEYGGRMIRDAAEGTDARAMLTQGMGAGQGAVVGRTKWIPKSDLWPTRPDRALTEKAAHEAINAALTGQPLKPMHQRFIDHVLAWSAPFDDATLESSGYNDLSPEAQAAVASIIEEDSFAQERALEGMTDDEVVEWLNEWSETADARAEEAPGAAASGAREGYQGARQADEGTADRPPPAPVTEPAQTPSPEGVSTSERPALELAGQTEEEIRAEEESKRAEAREAAAAEERADAKEKADRARDSFALSGSDRQADANPNQGDIFAQAEAIPPAPADPAAEIETTGPTDSIADFGEKIGGARKDTARPLGPKARIEKAVDERPAWARKYIAVEQLQRKGGLTSTLEKTGKWELMKLDTGRRGSMSRVSRQTYDTEEAALASIPLAEVARNHRVYSYKAVDGSVMHGIFRKISDRKRALVKGGFPSEEAAMQEMATNPVPIIEHKFAFPEKPWLDRIERTGAQRRNGHVTTKMFQDTFGFRGGEFGNWNMGSDGQAALDHAYDALMDLAETIGVPPKALSLNGELAIAFGARGTGGKDSARAHYEPAAVVINLTKIKGAGSLAHEWFHALDDYLARSSDTEASKRVRTMVDDRPYASYGFPSSSTARPELVAAFKATIDAMTVKKQGVAVDENSAKRGLTRAQEATKSRLDNERRYIATARPYGNKKAAATPAQLKAWDGLAERALAGDNGPDVYVPAPKGSLGRGHTSSEVVRGLNDIYKAVTGRSFDKADAGSTGRQLYWSINSLRDMNARMADAQKGTIEERRSATEFLDEAKRIDDLRASDYWSTRHEMGARAFEAYIFDKMAAAANRSDYLVHGVENRFYAALGMKPYPEGEERQAINAAFDNLFKVIQTRETDKGVEFHDIDPLSRFDRLTSHATPAGRGRLADTQIAIRRIERLSERGDDEAAHRELMRLFHAQRKASAGRMRARLAHAAVSGDLNPASAKLAMWVLKRAPHLADDASLAFETNPALPAAGTYSRVDRIITLMTGRKENGQFRGDHLTAAHEFMHHAERMMPAEIQQGIREEWARRLLAYRRAAEQAGAIDGVRFVGEAIRLNAGDGAAQSRMRDMLLANSLRADEMYELTNPSEFWAENASRILNDRKFAEEHGWVAKARQWLKEFVQQIREILGLQSDAPMLRALDQILNGTGERQSDTMLAEDPNNTALAKSRQDVYNALDVNAAAKAVRENLSAQVVAEVPHRFANSMRDLRRIGLQALGRRQLVDIYQGDLPALTHYNELAQEMDAEKNEAGAEADNLVREWAKLPDERALADLMHDATLGGTDPDRDGGPLTDRFMKLSDGAKAIYRQARDMYEAHYNAVREATREKLKRVLPDSPKRDELLRMVDDVMFRPLKGVYFPLARFGEYVVIARKPDGKQEAVSFAETLNEAEEVRAALLSKFPRDKGYTVDKIIKRPEYNAARDAVGRGFVKELFDVLDKAGSGDDLKDAINQLYLTSLPDVSWAKHGLHRKGTPGFSQDARRAFAANVFHGARYLAKLRYADRLEEGLELMQAQLDEHRKDAAYDSVAAQQVVDEMRKRHDIVMNPTTSSLSTNLTSLGFIFHLGLSPASAMVNLAQTPMVAYPLMAAKYGWGRAARALMTASRQVAGHRNDLEGKLAGDEERAYEQAVKAGVIDVTLSHDLAGIASGEDSKAHWKLRPVMRAASLLFHHAEKFNRQATFLAAYRLARATGLSHAKAYAEAVQDTYDGHFDYGSSNRPRFMQGNVARVVLLFKQFGQNMIYTMARNAYKAARGDKQAQQALAGLLATHAAAAGVLGLPAVSSLLAMASMVGGADDEPWDAEVALRNMLAETFGKKPAEVLAHGLSRLTPWDVSGRLGLDRLIFPDVREGLAGADWVKELLLGAAGPIVGMGVNAGKGALTIAKGDWQRGLEEMAPSALRGPMRSVRYAMEGARDKTGIQIIDDFSVSELAGQALGFAPGRAGEAYEGKGAVYQAERALNDRRRTLLTQYAHARQAGDAEGMKEALEAIQRFNQKNPARRITGANINASMRLREKRQREAEHGLYLPKNHREVTELGRFAVTD